MFWIKLQRSRVSKDLELVLHLKLFYSLSKEHGKNDHNSQNYMLPLGKTYIWVFGRVHRECKQGWAIFHIIVSARQEAWKVGHHLRIPTCCLKLAFGCSSFSSTNRHTFPFFPLPPCFLSLKSWVILFILPGFTSFFHLCDYYLMAI